MAIKINAYFMSVAIDSSVIASAARTDDGRWTVHGWPGQFSRERAIIALVRRPARFRAQELR